MKISIIATALPPGWDGIGDYTAKLAAELAKTVQVTILAAEGVTPTPIPGVAIRQVFDAAKPASVRALLPEIQADKPDWVLLQYNPFMYGRWGLNLTLPQVMRQIQRRIPGTRFAMMMHESFVPIDSVRFAVMSLWQRLQLWQLGWAADLMFCSVDPWTKRFRRWFPKTPVSHLPVGSNIPHIEITRAEARARLGIAAKTVVLGVFGSSHPSRMMNRVRGAAEAVRHSGLDVLVLYMGANGDNICQFLGEMPTLAEGPLAGEEVSRRFAAIDIVLTPFVDGVSTRRGSLMASLQHGLPTVGTQAFYTDELLIQENGKSLLLADVKSQDDFDAHVLCLAEDASQREKIGHGAGQLFEREFAWSKIVEKMLARMAAVS